MPKMRLNSSIKKLIDWRINAPINGLATMTIAKITIIPRRSKASIPRRTNSGAKAYSTRDPSSGGSGIILKMKKPRFTVTTVTRI
ncbi:hypothetical protein D3C72_1654600 [compost metagenome]